ncbi:hypothetical protein P4O66_012635, partial [Electrophorus voltai]
NVLVIVIVMATKTFHCVTSVLIINLAVSDFLVGIGVMPFVAVSIVNNGWVNCTDLCLYVGYTSSVYCTASVLTLAAIALDRYFSIVDCLRYNARCTVWRTGAAVLWIWLQAMLTSSPPLLGWSNISFVNPMYSCAVNWASSPSYTVFMVALSFLVPAMVILFCYVKIVRVARHHARRIHSLEEHLQRGRDRLPPAAPRSARRGSAAGTETHDPSRLVYYVSGRFVSEARFDAPCPPVGLAGSTPVGEGSSRPAGRRLHAFLAHLQSGGHAHHAGPAQHHGVARLFMVIAAFFLCWTPYMGVALVQATEMALSRPASQVPPAAVTFSYWLVLFNSDINPLLYALLSKRFQGALQSLREKVRAWLGGVVSRGGQERMDGESRGCLTPNTVATASGPSGPRDSGPGMAGSAYSSVFTVSAPIHQSHKERANEARPGCGTSPSSSSLSTSSSTCSLWHSCGESSLDNSGCLRVPSKPQERDRLPSSAAAEETQATFFYGQITVRVEHEIC